MRAGNGAAMADVPANKPGAIASAEAPADAKPAEPKEGLIEDGDDSNDEEELEEEEEEEEEEEAAANAEAGPSTAQTGSDEQVSWLALPVAFPKEYLHLCTASLFAGSMHHEPFQS